MAMGLREFLVDRYAPLRGIGQRSLVMFGHTVDRVEEFLGRPATVEDLNDLEVARFLRWRAVTPRRGRMVSAATVAKDRAHLASMADLAARKKLLPEFLTIAKVRVPTRPPRGYTLEEVSAMIRAGKRRKGMVGDTPAAWLWMTLPWAAWLTGERIGALLRVRWEEVDLDAQVITFLGETRKDHVTTIQRSIDGELARVMLPQRKADTALVWPWLEHRTERAIYASLRLLCETAGVTPRGFHAIRKASASYISAAGGDASQHLGHTNPKTTQRHYLDPRIVGHKSAVPLLPPLDLTPPPARPAKPPAPQS